MYEDVESNILSGLLISENYDEAERYINSLTVDELDGVWIDEEVSVPVEFVRRFDNSPNKYSVYKALSASLDMPLITVLPGDIVDGYKEYLYTLDPALVYYLYFGWKPPVFPNLHGPKYTMEEYKNRHRVTPPVEDSKEFLENMILVLYVDKDLTEFHELAGMYLDTYGYRGLELLEDVVYNFWPWPEVTYGLPRSVALAYTLGTGENKSEYREFDYPRGYNYAGTCYKRYVRSTDSQQDPTLRT